MRMYAFTVVFAFLLHFSQVQSTSYVDFDEKSSIEKLAEVVCKTNKGTENLIGKASTIQRLVDFFMEVESEHKLFDCRKKYMGPLAQLSHVIYSYSDNVCGDDKLNLIETYHRKYISRVRKHLREQKRGGRAPEMAKLFFMQYATEISSVCEQKALETIDKNKHTLNPDELAKVESLKQFTDSLGMTDLSNGYNGIYLFWNMVDALDLARDDKFSSYLADDASVRVNIQMKDAKPIKAVQVLCRNQMRPFYSKSLLPVLRLVDMGYYPKGDQLANRLKHEPATRGLFFASQICETLLPIEGFSDPQLNKDQLVTLTKDQAAQLMPEKLEESTIRNIQPIEAVVVVPSSLKLMGNELIFDSTSSSQLITIKSNVDSRSKVINRLLKQLASHLKNKLLSMFKGFKLFHRSVDKKLEPISQEPIKEMKPFEITEVKEGQEEKEWAMRTKRASFFGEIGYMTYLLIYFLFYVLKVIFIIVPTLVALPFILAGRKKLGTIIFSFWDYGDPLDV